MFWVCVLTPCQCMNPVTLHIGQGVLQLLDQVDCCCADVRGTLEEAPEDELSRRTPPIRRVLQLSPDRAKSSAAAQSHRISASKTLTLGGVSSAPLWQVLCMLTRMLD